MCAREKSVSYTHLDVYKRQTLVSACDALMLGKLAQNAMSAVSLAGQVAFVLSLFTAALTIGGSMFAAQYWGKKDIDAVERIFALTRCV